MESIILLISESISIINLIYDIYIYTRVKKYVLLTSADDKCMFLYIRKDGGTYESFCNNPLAQNNFINNGSLCPKHCSYRVGNGLNLNAIDVIKNVNPISILKLVSELIVVLMIAATLVLHLYGKF